jgi:hypothetical protein
MAGVVAVGDGRGFVIETAYPMTFEGERFVHRRRYIVTAAHSCHPLSPPAASYTYERTFGKARRRDRRREGVP